MSHMKATIPEPCHEDWQQMNPTEKGRFCAKCSTEVFEFANLNNQELQAQLKSIYASRKPVCAQFSGEQLAQEKPAVVDFNGLRFWQQVLAAFVFAFILGGFSSCKVVERTGGAPMFISGTSAHEHLRSADAVCAPKPTVIGDHRFGGEVVISLPPDKTDPPPISIGKVIEVEQDPIKDIEPRLGGEPVVHDLDLRNSADLAQPRPVAFFGFDNVTLKPSDEAFIDAYLDSLQTVGEFTIEVVGHTDNVGSNVVNKSVSAQRAQAVAAYLEEKGVDPADVRGVSYQFPVANNASMAGRKRNRRVELIARPKQNIDP